MQNIRSISESPWVGDGFEPRFSSRQSSKKDQGRSRPSRPTQRETIDVEIAGAAVEEVAQVSEIFD